MPVTFPATKLTIEVSLALGADLTADPGTWSWTDITAYTRRDPPISITQGRRDETDTAQPAQCTLWLDNTSGRFTSRNPSGAYYPDIHLNTPLRVRVNPGTGLVEVFSGFVDEWPLRWDQSAREKHVEVTASGVLRRLGQGGATRSALYREIISTDDLVAYWPLEDGQRAAQGASAITGVEPMMGNLELGGNDAPGGSAPLPDLSSRGEMFAKIPYRGATEYRVECVAKLGIEGVGAGDGPPIVQWTSPGDITIWRIIADTTGFFGVTYFDGTQTDLVGPTPAFDGQWHHLRVDVEDSGADVDVTLYVDGVLSDAWTVVGTSFDWPEEAGLVTFDATEDQALPALGHYAVWSALNSTDTADAAFGWAGEQASDRVARICTEEGLDSTVTAATGTEMGPQPIASVAEILADVERTDLGLLYESGAGIAYIAREDRTNLSAALALDYDTGDLQHPLEAADDDQQIRNDITASQDGGSSAQYVDTDGPMGTAAVGIYQESVTVNVADGAELYQHAAWRVGLGTVDDLRYPQIGLHFARTPSLITAWLAGGIGSRVTVANPPAELPPGSLDLQVVGYTQEFNRHTWTAVLNTVPNRPYNVFTVEGSANTGRFDTSGSVLVGDYAAGTTSLKVHTTTGAPWDTSDVPYDLGAGGEQITATAVATNAATFVNAGTAASDGNAAGTSSLVPGLPASIAARDLLLIWAAIRNSGTGTVNLPTGWTSLAVFGNCRLMGKYWDGSEGAPTITFAGGAANATVIAQMCAFRNASLTVHNSATQLNGSAANISTPALLITRDNCVTMRLGWKQDDWTSVAPPGVMTEIGEPDDAAGDDAGLTWAYDIQTTGGSLGAQTFTVTGGANAISRSIAIALAGDVQTFTATRAVNGVSKAQTNGTTVALWRPSVLAL